MYQKNIIYTYMERSWTIHCVDTKASEGNQLKEVHIYFCYTIVSCNNKLLIHFVDVTRLRLIVLHACSFRRHDTFGGHTRVGLQPRIR